MFMIWLRLKIFGYVVIPQAVNTANLYELCESILSEKANNILNPSEIVKSDELMTFYFDQMIQQIKRIFDFSIIMSPDFVVLKNTQGGWHIDSGSMTAQRLWHVSNPLYAQYTAAVYLNDYEDGGLQVIPLSHWLMFFPFRAFNRFFHKFIKFDHLALDIKANSSSLIIWHFNTLHRARPVYLERKRSKIGLFCCFSTSRKDALIYQSHLKFRSDENDFYRDVVSTSRDSFEPYPTKYQTTILQ